MASLLNVENLGIQFGPPDDPVKAVDGISFAMGAGDFRIIVRHLLPNSLGPIMVVGTFGVASAILIESSLSFLGFGMQAPTPSWGDVLSDARRYVDFAWWLAFFPGMAILITIMSYNFVGEGLRDAVDPRLKVGRNFRGK